MTLSDKTLIFAAPAVVVTVERGTAARQEYRFLHNFRLGRGDDCEVRFNDQQVRLILGNDTLEILPGRF